MIDKIILSQNIFSYSFCFRQIEGKVMEIAKLQETFTEKVLEQVSSLCLLRFIITIKTEKVYVLHQQSPLCEGMG